MKKKILGLLIIPLCMFGMINVVKAEHVDCNNGSPEAKIGDVCYDTLVNAFSEATDSNTIVLLKDLISDTYINAKNEVSDANLTFDLNGYKIISSSSDFPGFGTFYFNGSQLTIVDNSSSKSGLIQNTGGYSAIILVKGELILNGGKYSITTEYFQGDKAPNTGAIQIGTAELSNETLEVNDGAVIEGITGITIFGTNQTVNINGGNITGRDGFAVSGNGSQTHSSTITITGGNLTSNENAAIYHPQTGTLTINGGNITGAVGIVARQGTINIEGGTITANGDPSKKIKTGDATKDGKPVEIPSGIGIVVDNDEGKYGETTVTVDAGDFNTNADPVKTLKEPEGKTKSEEITVNGGKFNKSLEVNYLASNKKQTATGTVAEESKIHQIELSEDIVNGTVKVVTNAAEGEIVKITINPNSGYRVSSIRVMNGEQEVAVTGYYSFTMPAGNVKISVTFVKVETSSSESNKIVVEESSEDVTLSESSMETLKEILENTTDEELKSLLGKEDITILLENKEITKESLSEEEVTKFENILEDGTIAEYLDLNIVVKASGHTDHYLKELSSLITIEVKLPELPAVKEGYSRKYYILREHDGVVEKLDATLSEDGKSLTFASDKFSKYAIAYVDEEVHDEVVDKNPSTVDNIMSYVALTIASIGLLGVSSKKIIKN